MTRIKILVSPILATRQASVEIVNRLFNDMTKDNVHRDIAHANKRVVAESILTGVDAPEEFASEAILREMTPLELAQSIVSKPNEAAIRELDRQKILIRISQADSKGLESIIRELGGVS